MPIGSIFSKSWWSQTETPRWQLAVSGVAGATLVTIGTIVSTIISDSHKSSNDARIEQLRAVVDASVKLQTSVSAFTTEFLSEGTIKTSTRVELNKVLNEQFARVRSTEYLLPQSDRRIADEYLSSLASLVKVASEVGTGPSETKYEAMKPFWSSLSKVIVDRNKFDQKLQEQVRT